MKHIILITLTLLMATLGSKLKAADVGLSADPGFITIEGKRYAIVELGKSVTFSTSPSATTTLVWVFENGSASSGVGNGPFDIVYSDEAAQGAVSSVKFASTRFYGGDECTTPLKVAASVLVPKFDYNKEQESPEVTNYIDEGVQVASGKIELKTDVKITLGVSGISMGTISSSRGSGDTFTPSSGSTEGGIFETTLKTKDKSPSLKVQISPAGTTIKSDDHDMLPAKYKDTFHITGYFTPNEVNYSGTKVTSTTLTTGSGATYKQYNITSPVSAKSSFLKEVAVEGEGFLDSGTHIVVSNTTVPGTSNPIQITSVMSTNSGVPLGTMGRALDSQSCAITRSGSQGIVIPDAAMVTVPGHGSRSAIDRVASNETGGIYHIDIYTSFDKAAANLINSDVDVVLESY